MVNLDDGNRAGHVPSLPYRALNIATRVSEKAAIKSDLLPWHDLRAVLAGRVRELCGERALKTRHRLVALRECHGKQVVERNSGSLITPGEGSLLGYLHGEGTPAEVEIGRNVRFELDFSVTCNDIHIDGKWALSVPLHVLQLMWSNLYPFVEPTVVHTGVVLACDGVSSAVRQLAPQEPQKDEVYEWWLT